MNFDRCPIIGYPLNQNEIKPITGALIEYETEYVGKVKITLPAYKELLEGNYDRYSIAGICKNRTLKNEDPLLIDSNFIRDGYKKLNPPNQFDEKCKHFLKYLYEYGGKDNKEFEFYSSKHFPLSFAEPEEFTRIIDQLINDNFITVRTTHRLGGVLKNYLYIGLKLTNDGKNEVKKSLPKMPLFGLVNQTIETGDSQIDEKLNHARQLFFDDNSSLDKMRSACETLSHILEPMRDDLKLYFNQKDVSDFFQIVNNFDIRHNKESTKNLIYEEQLEWIFYSLLNTINTYTKLKQRNLE